MQQRLSVVDQTVHPRQLVVEFRPRHRIAVGQVQAPDDEAGLGLDLDVSRLLILLVTGQGAQTCGDRCAGEDGNPVVALLPDDSGVVACGLDLSDGKLLVLGFDFLQAHDIGAERR